MAEVDETHWRAGLSTELGFWREWLATGGGEWPEDFAARMDPDTPLQEHVARWAPQRPVVRILDVGAGPLTALGKRLYDVDVQLDAVDPLAPEYDAVLAELNITPPLRTVLLEGEHLTGVLGRGKYDITHAQNALDHMRDPVFALGQMVAVTAVGGYVVLNHVRNEAERNGDDGLHHWNISTADGVLRVAGIDVRSMLGPSVEVVHLADLGGWDLAVLRRVAVKRK